MPAGFGKPAKLPLERKSGRWDIPDAPGSGVSVIEDVIEAHPFQQEPFATADAVGRDGIVPDW